VIDFRYHALSLVAVFLALGIGIVLGVTIGDELLSQTDKRLRQALRDDVVQARDEARRQQELGRLRDEVIADVAPAVARGRLRRRRIALVTLGEAPGEVVDGVEQALDLGGGRLHSQTTFDAPGELDDLASALGRTVPVSTPDQAERLGRGLARALLRGRRRLRRLRAELPRRFDGAYAGRIDRIVLYRAPPPDSSSDAAALRESFEQGLTDALRPPVVGVELMGTDPSQVGFYDDHAVASVDDLDLAAGRLALVLVLAERAKGRFGFKDSAERPVPQLD
jgi:hypothetical protein